MIRRLFSFSIQNKNFVMFLTSMIYILGLYAFYSNFGIILSLVLSLFAIVLILKNYASPKMVLFWVIMFYFGFFNASFRECDIGTLYSLAPRDVTVIGQVLLIVIMTIESSFSLM